MQHLVGRRRAERVEALLHLSAHLAGLLDGSLAVVAELAIRHDALLSRHCKDARLARAVSALRVGVGVAGAYGRAKARLSRQCGCGSLRSRATRNLGSDQDKRSALDSGVTRGCSADVLRNCNDVNERVVAINLNRVSGHCVMN